MITKSVKIVSVFILAGSLFFTQNIKGQYDGDFLKAGIDDGMNLIEAYVTPYANAFGAGFNSAWYNTAKPHKFGGFDLTLTVSVGFVPETAKEFDLNDIGLTNLELVDPSNSIAPTIAGVNTPGPELFMVEDVEGFIIPILEMESPPGTGVGVVPAPMLQAGIGMPLGTELKIRYAPHTPIREGSAQLFGGGIVHSISQYIKPLQILPVNISAFGGYSKLSASIPMTVKPDNYDHYITYSAEDFIDQYINLDVAAWNISLLGSIDLPLVTGYAGIGYGSTITIIDIEGNIPIPTVDLNISTIAPVYIDDSVIEDIEAVTIENFSGLRLNVGGRLKLGVLTIHADYTRALYNVVTVGIGISFR